jgi:hypothetical protein
MNQLDRIEAKVDRLLQMGRVEIKGEIILMSLLDDVTVKINKLEDVGDGMETLLATLSQAIRDAGTDPVKLAAIASKVDAKTTEWSDAIVANTPAAPPTP